VTDAAQRKTVADATHDGRPVRPHTLIDEFTRECLAIEVARRIDSFCVIETFAYAMLRNGIPAHKRSDNGPEMNRQGRLGVAQPDRLEDGLAVPGRMATALQRQAQG
jgi:hypothetical protein